MKSDVFSISMSSSPRSMEINHSRVDSCEAITFDQGAREIRNITIDYAERKTLLRHGNNFDISESLDDLICLELFCLHSDHVIGDTLDGNGSLLCVSNLAVAGESGINQRKTAPQMKFIEPIVSRR